MLSSTVANYRSADQWMKIVLSFFLASFLPSLHPCSISA